MHDEVARMIAPITELCQLIELYWMEENGIFVMVKWFPMFGELKKI